MLQRNNVGKMKKLLTKVSIVIMVSLVFLFASCTDSNNSENDTEPSTHETVDWGLGIIMPEK